MQLTFLPEINRDQTKKNVESALEKYKMFLLMDPEDIQPKITTTFQLTPPTYTNEFHSTTEDVAIKRGDMETERKRFINRVLKAVNRLNYEERTVIITRYLTDEDVFDYETYNQLGYSESKYYRVRARSFYKLAFILHIEVYEKGVV